jgi:hypothetical protein
MRRSSWPPGWERIGTPGTRSAKAVIKWKIKDFGSTLSLDVNDCTTPAAIRIDSPDAETFETLKSLIVGSCCPHGGTIGTSLIAKAYDLSAVVSTTLKRYRPVLLEGQEVYDAGALSDIPEGAVQ